MKCNSLIRIFTVTTSCLFLLELNQTTYLILPHKKISIIFWILFCLHCGGFLFKWNSNDPYIEPLSSINQFSSVAQLCPTLCDPTDCSTPGFPVHHHLLKLTQTHVHQVGDAIQPIASSVVPFSSCFQSFPASGSSTMSQFFTSGGQTIRVLASVSVLPMNIQDWIVLSSIYITSQIPLTSSFTGLPRWYW